VPYNRPFVAYLAKHGADLDAYMIHEHYTWNSARPRVQHGTIEIRPACQQPPDEPLAASALCLAWVEAMPQVWAYLCERLGPDPWPAMTAYHREAIRHGVRAREPVRRFLAGLVEIAASALRRRGRGEERYLDPIRRRLETRTLPADRAVRIFRRGGVATLVRRLSLHPGMP
jgi:hypothetical protein